MRFLTLSLLALSFLAIPATASAAGGDFDGDGFADLAIGAPADSVSGKGDAGAVNVIYGSRSGLREDPDQQFTQDTRGVKGFASLGDRFGAALATGDFDGDGFSDLAIGVPGEDARGEANQGVVNVLYGSRRGLTTRGDQIWHQDIPGIKGTGEPDQNFGAALAVGDFDDDGRDDLAIGVPDDSVSGQRGAGAVNVLHGSRAGLREEGDQLWHQDTPGIEGRAGEFDRFGRALAAGDLNGDGRDDLAIGVPGERIGDAESGGAVNVIYATRPGLREDPDQLWHQDSPGIKGVAGRNDNFGRALAIGDLNGDGRDDLAVGAPLDTVNGNLGAGAVNVIYGSRGVLREDPDQVWTQDTPGIKGVAGEGDRFGAALAAADLSRNGRAELVVGVPNEDVGRRRNAGAVNVLYGRPGRLREDPDQLWSQDSSGVLGRSERFDDFGEALAVGDFDGDGAGDLAIGAPRDSVRGSRDGGALNVLYGSVSGLGESRNQLWTQGSPGIKGAVGNDRFGAALASG